MGWKWELSHGRTQMQLQASIQELSDINPYVWYSPKRPHALPQARIWQMSCCAEGLKDSSFSTTGWRSFPGGHEAAYILPDVDSSMCSTFSSSLKVTFFFVATK